MKVDVLYNEDCSKGMRKRLLDESIDLTLTSPPYDNLRTYGGYIFNFGAIAQELYRVTKEGGVVVWVVGDATIKGSETGTSFKQALYFKECGFNLHDTMIWNKGNCRFPEINRYYPCFEYMFILSKRKPRICNLIKDRVNKYAGDYVSRAHSTRTVDGRMIANSAFKIAPQRTIKGIGVRFNIWNIPVSACVGDKVALQHPASFPEQLANDHIISWSNEDDIVLDPMFGSGTTLKMAMKNKRHYIGFEINPEYCEIARKRLAEVQLELIK